MNDPSGSGRDEGRRDPSLVRVSVAIPTRNRPEKVRDTVKSILAGSHVPEEIVVSDQSADETTCSVLEEIRRSTDGGRIRYVRSTRSGASSNRNDAFRESSGDFIAFVDDDIRVDRNWMENMLGEWKERWNCGPVLISGRILPAVAEGSMHDPGTRLSSERSVVHNRPRSGDLLYGGAFGASRELIDFLGSRPFDERLGPGSRFRGGEDEDFGYRALMAGFPVVYEPAITVSHFPDMANWRRSSFNRSYGGGAFFAKHILLGDRELLRNFLRVLLIQIGKSLRSYARLSEREGTMRMLSFAGLLAGFFRWVLEAKAFPSHVRRMEGREDST